jgi:hypothetical protein
MREMGKDQANKTRFNRFAARSTAPHRFAHRKNVQRAVDREVLMGFSAGC